MSGCLNGFYKEFAFRIDGKTVKVNFHQLQAYTKFGDEIFNNDCVRHLNDNQEDNSWDNIELGSRSDNMQDAVKNGGNKLVCNAAVKVNRKLTDDQCIDVFNLINQGCTQKFIRLKYGLAKSTMSCILKSDYYKKAISYVDFKERI